MFNFWYLIL